MMFCLPVCNVGICGQTVVLSSYLSTRECM